MKSDSGNVYYILETVAVLSSISFLVIRRIRQDRRSRLARKVVLKSMPNEDELNKKFEANRQSGNCIVAATCNILWYHGHHGFPKLIEGVDFKGLEGRIDTIIQSKGGYANNNVPETVEEYVSTYTPYNVKVKNRWYPSYNDVKKAAKKNPCLLGFAKGPNSYGAGAGHMTACVWADESEEKKMVGVLDGHKDHIVYWEWGEYNDFMSEFILTKKTSEDISERK
ncbi:MAG: hypothetical protein IKH92_09185 [Clostridiales bacterium]|nr:hypothetical protein [Clostridiales bacterium]